MQYTFWNEFASRYAAGETMTSLAKEYGVDRTNAHTVMSRLGVARKTRGSLPKYIVDTSVFDDPEDYEDSAYWLGFLLADGCVYKPRNSNPIVSLSLAAKDSDHVHAFKTFLGTDAPIRIRDGFPTISIRSSVLADKLAEWNVVPRKSLKEEPPTQLLENRHFWRGLVDGDGHVSRDNRGYSRLELCGSYCVCTAFIAFCVQHTTTRVTASPDKRTPGLFRVQLCGKPAADVHTVLYKDATICLTRKALVVV